ncbi:ATP-binding protein [Candidatus Marithrix sp. Canyon 246]|uniref:ATP-binding protein n=1 Tax=Candidatus Marithrix sp. Canyon 246 TaxID=1827136 RepID=UPI000849F381|nr:AAA family ATPase [Candidatus Marithrix sp. Canyon 246]
MKRSELSYLEQWKDKNTRKPLVIRGARQVGKSYLVRQFAQIYALDILEINFELNDDYIACFQSKDPKQIIVLLELKASQKIIPGKTLIFLDEIQTAPQVLASLRYFYEILPQLHIIAAGSLLDFILEEHSFSMPVGRIEYMHLGPLKFKDFLKAIGKEQLGEFIEQYDSSTPFFCVIHDELIKMFKLYLAIGGMPEAIQVYKDTGSLLEVDMIKQSILLSYRDDFSKYGRRFKHSIIQKVFKKLPFQIGQKLKYVNLDSNEKSSYLKNALHLLELAKIYYPVYHTAANGIPLRAQTNEKIQKPLFLDVGLLTKACGVNYAEIEAADEVTLINSGSMCEQFIGQHLLYAKPSYEEPELFYWCREKRQSSAEIDYILNYGSKIIPVEIKAGKTGTLKSLHVFIQEKQLDYGVRFNADIPSYCEIPISLPRASGKFRLLSLPLYMVEELSRMVNK